MYLGIYAVILMTGILLLRRRKRIEIARDGKPSAAYKNSSAGFAALMVFCGLVAGIMQAAIYHDYRIFTEKRKETVVKETGMCDSDDVRYQHFIMSFGGQGGTNRNLTLKCRIAPMTVLETCCQGKLLAFTADGIVYDAAALTDADGIFHYDAALPDDEDRDIYARGTVQDCTGKSGCTGFFEYSFNGHRYWIFCYEDGSEWYRMKIRA